MERRVRTSCSNLAGKITVIEREYETGTGTYECFLEDCSFVGEVLHTPESRTAFANNNWAFFEKALNIAD